MLFLERFRLPDRTEEEKFLWDLPRRTCYPTKYPFNVFRYRQVPELEFAPITILYGGNGSGKSTVLNVMAERLKLQRGTVYNRSEFFEDYVNLCTCKTSPRPEGRVITSDDVFDYLLNIRYLNENLDNQRKILLQEYRDMRYSKTNLQSLSDYETLKKQVDAQRRSGSGYVKENLMDAVPEQSNGESALRFFTEAIGENQLYLLDEPENSLSAGLQLELLRYLTDSARFYGCQFVISTHSPFLLSIPGAKIYDLDADPVCVKPWTALENVRIYQEFFKKHEMEFT